MKHILLRVSAIILVCAIAVCSFGGCSSEEVKPTGNIVDVTLEEGDVFAVIKVADYGSITVKLFPEIAPKAVERFITLATRGYYDGKNFHRVISDMLIQGGSLTGNGYDGEVVENEYFDVETSQYACHFYGALCFAANSQGNYSQFYIVSNNVPTDITAIAGNLRTQLDDEEISKRMLEADKTFYEEYYSELMSVPDDVKEKYAKVGGDYYYDGDDTVFGQTVDGFDVIEAIEAAETVTGNSSDDTAGTPSKPLDEIIIESVEVVRIAASEEEGSTKTSKVTAAETLLEETSTAVSESETIVNETVATAETVLTAETDLISDTTSSEASTDTSEAEASTIIEQTATETEEDTAA